MYHTLYSDFSEQGNKFADSFTEFRTVYLINLKNAGRSDRAKNKKELSIQESIKDLESIREALGYTKWSYAGHSTGGFLGLFYAIEHQDSLQELIISGSAASKEFSTSLECIYNPKGKYGKEYMKIFFKLYLPFSTKKKKTLAQRKWIELSLYKPEKYEEYFSAGHSLTKTNGSRTRAYLRDLRQYDLRQQLTSIEIPSLILSGHYDVQCPVQFSEEICI